MVPSRVVVWILGVDPAEDGGAKGLLKPQNKMKAYRQYDVLGAGEAFFLLTVNGIIERAG